MTKMNPPPDVTGPHGQGDLFPKRDRALDYQRQTRFDNDKHDPAPKAPRQYTAPITWGRQMPVQHGVLDESSDTTYTQGQCHAFALALHHTHGWNVGVVQDPEDGVPTHWYAEHPTGAVADIHGLHAPEDFARKWGADPGTGERPASGYPHPAGSDGGIHVGSPIWNHQLRDVRTATPQNVAKGYQDRLTQHLRTDSEDAHPYHLESVSHPGMFAADLVHSGEYVKPHMTAAKSLARPWTKQRAGHWQPNLPLEWEGVDR